MFLQVPGKEVHAMVFQDHDLPCLGFRTRERTTRYVQREASTGSCPVGSVRAESCLYPKLRMSFAELVSRSSSVPHSQECQRSDRSFFTIAPHPEQS